jgi:hypothetical protein
MHIGITKLRVIHFSSCRGVKLINILSSGCLALRYLRCPFPWTYHCNGRHVSGKDARAKASCFDEFQNLFDCHGSTVDRLSVYAKVRAGLTVKRVLRTYQCRLVDPCSSLFLPTCTRPSRSLCDNFVNVLIRKQGGNVSPLPMQLSHQCVSLFSSNQFRIACDYPNKQETRNCVQR